MSRTVKKARTGGKAVSRHCQNHGGCEYCYSNRLIHTLKELDRTSLKYDVRYYHRLEEEAYYKLPDIYEDWDTYQNYFTYEQKTLPTMSTDS